MRTFATETIKAIQGKQTFEKLTIDGVCLLDEFEAEIKSNPQFQSEYKTILAYMNFAAEGTTLPQKKFREIKGGNIKTKRYEFKSKHLRIYAFHNPNGKIVVLGGYKPTQDKDIKQLNAIVKEYIATQSKNTINL